MATAPERGRGDGGGADGPHAGIDWVGVEGSPEFRELAAQRRRFLVPATVFFLAFFLVYLVLTAYAHDFMATEILGMPLAFLLAVAQILMAWVVTALYLRASDREFEPLERRAAEAAAERFTTPAAPEGPR